MSVKEARKLLGKEAENMSDKQIEQLIEDTHVMAKFALEMAREKLMQEQLDLEKGNSLSVS